MKNYGEPNWAYRSQDKKSVDLYIISDGTNPGMESYMRKTRDKIPFMGKWSFKWMRVFGLCSFSIGSVLLFFAAQAQSVSNVMVMSVLGTLGIVIALVFLIFSRGFTGLFRRMGVPNFFIKRVRHVDKLKFAILNDLIVNRRRSVVQMITKVFIKQMRWFGFERVYSDNGWKPRLVLNAVFELTREEVEKRRRKYPYYSEELIEPGEKIMAVSSRALTKGTTLWFTEEELKGENNMADSIIACGQFTMCFNLLEYYEKFLRNPKYKIGRA